MKKLFLAIAAVAMVFATSCKKENINGAEEPVVAADNEFVCVIDQNASQQNAPAVNDDMGQMAHIDGNNNVWWQEGDQIAYYGIENTQGEGYYPLTCSATSDKKAYFSDPNLHFGQGDHVAYYPASLYFDNNALTLPSEINLDADKNAGFLPMYGTGNGSHYLTFNNMCAVLKITVPASVTTCNKIELSANEYICGPFTMNGTKAQLTTTSGDDYKKITVNAPASTNFSGTVYVAIPEGEYHNFKVEFFDGTTYLGEKTNTSAMPVEAGKIYPVTVTPVFIPKDCFYFTNIGNTTGTFYLRTVYGESYSNINLKYYKNGMSDWADFVNGSGYSEYVQIAPNETVYIYSANGNERISESTIKYRRFYIYDGGELKVGGKLSYLLSPTATDKLDGTNNTYAFAYLFFDMARLKDASELILPYSNSVTLPTGYYYGMFRDCVALSSVFDNIIAGQFEERSCYEMFRNCTALQTAPTITYNSSNGTISSYAFYQMFFQCTSLKNVNLTVGSGTSDGIHTFYSWLKGATATGAVLTVTGYSNASSTFVSNITYNNNTPSNWTIKEGNTIIRQGQ